jgi:hypothetical protein
LQQEIDELHEQLGHQVTLYYSTPYIKSYSERSNHGTDMFNLSKKCKIFDLLITKNVRVEKLKIFEFYLDHNKKKDNELAKLRRELDQLKMNFESQSQALKVRILCDLKKNYMNLYEFYQGLNGDC